MQLSGRHVTTMVVAVCAAAILTPVAVAATTGTSVNVTDPVYSTQKARVGHAGGLWTTIVDPTTHSGAVIKSGQLQVGARPLPPGSPWNSGANVSGATTRAVIFQGNGATKLAITSMTIAANGAAGSLRVLVQVYVSDSASGDCLALGASFSAAERFGVTVPTGQTLNLTWPTPLVYTAYASAGQHYCVDAEATAGPSGYFVNIAASGYTF